MSTPAVIERYGPTQRRLLETLLRSPEGVAVDALIEDLGVTENAVRLHITALQRDRLVQQVGSVRTGGRPQFLYTLTDDGREAFPRRYQHMAEGLIGEVAESLGDAALKKAMRRMGIKAGEGVAAPKGGKVSVEEAAIAMKGLGYDARSQTSRKHGDEIVAHNCVFHHLASRHAAVCEFDLAFMATATGRKVDHRECMVRGGKVCRFGFGTGAAPKRK